MGAPVSATNRGERAGEGSIADVLGGTASWCVVHEPDERGCMLVLPTIPDKAIDHVVTDPPYSAATHGKSRTGASMPDGFSRERDLGFDELAPGQREALALEFARLTRRWVLAFSDQEGAGGWISAVAAAGLDHVRVGQWVKLGATPQFGGDRPANGAEAIEIAHPKGRKRWNGGGSHAVWTHPIVVGSNPERTAHTTQKPLPLMIELVELFTDVGEVVCDPFTGSCTTGVACLRLGRRFIGIERDAKYAALARERMRAEAQGLTLRDARLGQLPLLAGV